MALFYFTPPLYLQLHSVSQKSRDPKFKGVSVIGKFPFAVLCGNTGLLSPQVGGLTHFLSIRLSFVSLCDGFNNVACVYCSTLFSVLFCSDEKAPQNLHQPSVSERGVRKLCLRDAN
jgi:hypothetical protein